MRRQPRAERGARPVALAAQVVPRVRFVQPCHDARAPGDGLGALRHLRLARGQREGERLARHQQPGPLAVLAPRHELLRRLAVLRAAARQRDDIAQRAPHEPPDILAALALARGERVVDVRRRSRRVRAVSRAPLRCHLRLAAQRRLPVRAPLRLVASVAVAPVVAHHVPLALERGETLGDARLLLRLDRERREQLVLAAARLRRRAGAFALGVQLPPPPLALLARERLFGPVGLDAPDGPLALPLHRARVREGRAHRREVLTRVPAGPSWDSESRRSGAFVARLSSRRVSRQVLLERVQTAQRLLALALFARHSRQTLLLLERHLDLDLAPLGVGARAQNLGVRRVLGRRAHGFRFARFVERVHRLHASVGVSIRDADLSVANRLRRLRLLPLALLEKRAHARRLHQSVWPRLARANDVVEDFGIRVAPRREPRVERAHAAVGLRDGQARFCRQRRAPSERRDPGSFALLHVAHHGIQHALELHEQASRDAALLAHDGGHRARVQGDAQRLQGRLMVVENDVRMMSRDGVSACASRRRQRARDRRAKPGNRTMFRGLTEPNDVSRVPRDGTRAFRRGTRAARRRDREPRAGRAASRSMPRRSRPRRRTCSLVKLLIRASGVFLLTNLAKSGCTLHRARISPNRNPDANADSNESTCCVTPTSSRSHRRRSSDIVRAAARPGVLPRALL